MKASLRGWVLGLVLAGGILPVAACDSLAPTDTATVAGETKGTSGGRDNGYDDDDRDHRDHRDDDDDHGNYGNKFQRPHRPTGPSCYGRPDGSRCDDGDACTQTDACYRGQCRGSNPVKCSGGADSCRAAGVCNSKTGACVAVAKPDGTACDDGNACTTGDVCQAGACKAGGGRTCVASDQCHDAGTCNPSTGACSNPPKADGASCNDGNACTQADACVAGACAGGSPVTCAAADQCHGAGVCNPSTGTCSSPPVADGTACNDGNACTRADVCVAGTCAGGSPVVCAAQDQCRSAGTCDPGTGICSNLLPLPDGTACNDGNACTRADACQAGACVGAVPVTCVAADQCHDAGTCDPTSGACTNPIKPNGAACSDGNACTRADACQAGACVGAAPVTCVAADQCHDAGTCDPTSGACSNPIKTDGVACDDGNACTHTDSCRAGACGGQAVVCTASDQCHAAGSCDPASGACSNPAAPEGTACSDGDACTRTDVCRAGACRGADNVVCAAADQCHVAGVCDAATGACTNPIATDGTRCNDGDLCTQTDTCQLGACTGANHISCAASDQCHAPGTCDPSTGACSNPVAANGTSCNDGDACTRSDTCQLGRCAGAEPVVCAAADQCHAAGTCDPGTGTCSNPPVADDTACSDGNLCTQRDVCRAGACTGTTPIVCGAQDQCHVAGTCDPSTGACSNPVAANGTACSDGNACTRTDTCLAGRCAGGPPVVCVPADQCHVAGVCDQASGTCSSVTQAEGTACDDTNACTSGDSCKVGVCSPGVNRCVQLTTAQGTPTTKRFTVQLAASLGSDPAAAVPGDVVNVSSPVSNTGALLEFGNGTLDLTNANKETPFVVSAYQVTLEAASPSGLFTPFASFARNTSGAVVPPAGGLVSIQFTPSLIPSPGVIRAPNSPDALFATTINPATPARWTYSLTSNLPAAVVQALFAQGNPPIRCVIKFDTSVSPVPVDVQATATYTQLVGAFNGVLLDSTVAVLFAGFAGGTTLVGPPAGIRPGETFTFAGPLPAPLMPPKGAGETDQGYLNRLAGFGYSLRAHFGARVTAADAVGLDLSRNVGALLPVVVVTKTGPATVRPGVAATYNVALRNVGMGVAGPFSITDSVDGVPLQAGIDAPSIVGPGLTGVAAVVAAPPAGRAPGPLTDVATVLWQDRNRNSYGPVSASFTNVLAPQTLAFEDQGDSGAGAATAVAAARPSGGLALAGGEARLGSALPSGASLAGARPAFAPAGSFGLASRMPSSSSPPPAATCGGSLERVTSDASDLTVWLRPDLAVTVGRRYDSAAAGSVRDFGHGWELAFDPRLDLDAAQNAVMTLPDGRRQSFALGVSAYSSKIASLLRPVYTPVSTPSLTSEAAGLPLSLSSDDDVLGTLTADGCSLVTADAGRFVCFMDGGREYFPGSYTYSDGNGRVFTMTSTGQPVAIADVDGQVFTFDWNGILAGTGSTAVRVVRFDRDAQGRITRVTATDSRSNSTLYADYAYDQLGNLRAAALPSGTVQYSYDDGTHRLQQSVDGRALVCRE